MVDKNCEKSVAKALGPDSVLNKEEIADIVNEAERQIKAFKDANETNVSEAMSKWLKKSTDNKERDALIQKRNSAFNALSRVEMVKSVQDQFGKGKEVSKGVLALVYGDSFVTEFSATAMQKNYMNKWLNDIDYAISQLGEDHVSVLKNGTLDGDIADAMYSLKNDTGRLENLNPMAVKIGAEMNRVMEVIRRELNDAGAFIGKLDDYVWRQSHDMRKIKKAGYETWWKDMSENLDWGRTFGFTQREIAGNEELQEIVSTVSNRWFQAFSTGEHIKNDIIDTSPKGVGTGAGNAAKRMSQERKIHFTDGRSFFDYQSQYGIGSVLESVGAQIKSSARNMGLMRKLGPNYRNNIDTVIDDLKKIAIREDDNAALEALGSSSFQRNLRIALDTADGSTDIPANRMLSRVGSAARFLQFTSKLGASVFSAMTDITNLAANTRIKGRGFLNGYADGLNALFAVGKKGEDQRRVAKSMGIGFDVLRASLMDDFFSVDGQAGKMAKGATLFSRLSLIGPWTDKMRVGQIIGEASWLAELSAKNFDELDVPVQRALQLGEIEAPEWNVLRQALQTERIGSEDVTIMAPESVAELDDAIISKLITDRGDEASDFTIKRERTKLEEKLRSYYQDTVDSTVIEPTARTRTKILQGTQAGTTIGEIWRSVMQFKSFPLAIIGQRLQRDIQLRTGARATSVDSLKQAAGWAPAMGLIMFQLTAMGYVAMSMKDIAKGREPRDLTDATPEEYKDITLAAMAQGGGFGIYGDFLFGEVSNRFGGSFVDTLAGPSAGVVSGIADIYGRARNGDDTASAALRLIYNNTPAANLFYVRPAVDYFFMEKIFNELNPGQAQRREKRVFRNTGQHLLWNQTQGF